MRKTRLFTITFQNFVGQEGHRTTDFGDRPEGGGSGTFVTLLDDTPLIIAGGGRGGGTPEKQFEDGDLGQATAGTAPDVVGREGMVANLVTLIQSVWTTVT